MLKICFRERIIEWKVEASDPPKPLLDLSVTKFVHEVRARTAAPGGGSVAAIIGALVKMLQNHSLVAGHVRIHR